MENEIKDAISESIKIKQSFDNELISNIKKTAREIINALRAGKKLLIAGNGGSAADSQHFAAELVGRYTLERKALPAIALTTDSSILTAWSNDYSFDTVFSRQLEALGKINDVFFGISTSGNSKNIIEAARKAKELGIRTIVLSGNNGGKLKDIADISLIVPSSNTARIQESHIMIIHIICAIVEKDMAGK
ncbi:MAG TPA: D-sedoheptulose 7-phosphate isomerase [Candidatus Nanoarchaeia archaeon]|nr:D-sedoheptulose 7-phosphate isomerase [Candidatus Nanoarchaeia archaeon]